MKATCIPAAPGTRTGIEPVLMQPQHREWRGEGLHKHTALFCLVTRMLCYVDAVVTGWAVMLFAFPPQSALGLAQQGGNFTVWGCNVKCKSSSHSWVPAEAYMSNQILSGRRKKEQKTHRQDKKDTNHPVFSALAPWLLISSALEDSVFISPNFSCLKP